MTETEISRASVGLRSERGPILLAVMLSLGLVAIDSTILATAVPAVVDDLGGFTQFPWLFSIYLLAQAVTVPVYAKLADQYGRKPVMLVGIGLFLLGSLLCGLAWSMGALIAFRAVQGLGAGAVQPMCMTIVGDIYTLEERAKVQGYVASVWAISAVIGPTLGGVFADYVSWRWIFLVNLPLGLLAGAMIWRNFHERVERRAHRIDYAGSVLLTGGAVLLLLGLLEGGVRWEWDSLTSILLFAVAAVLLAGFVLVERRAVEPVLPLWLFRHRVVVAAMATSLVVGVLMMGLTTYIPLYAQSVLGYGAVMSGFALAAMTLGWPLAASNSGRLYLTVGFRTTMLIGGAIGAIGTALLLLIGPDSPFVLLALPCFVMGVGFGLIASPSIVAAQTAVTWQHRGVATGSTMFARSVGSAVGVAVFGAIVNHEVAQRLGRGVPDVSRLTADVLHPAIHDVFIASAFVALALLAVGMLMPRRVSEPESDEPAAAG
ncbi:disulfide bond formation protein DsbA [Nocardioides sp. Root1257]|uniref:MDR family MFS transporter n=1 Tax=unclassified Nocardioides TaxID=2615069 RepID=UPI0006F3A789|nr:MULTISPECIES: MDR family MFS transporter [unclassified Nocardioides]KQW47284.1 disulfide bond formation protein DsbA [Nocardioides sp. Root1257]KRC45440.1 disulfide bond formation protein DsbA [Nocardioides sp. Root224]